MCLREIFELKLLIIRIIIIYDDILDLNVKKKKEKKKLSARDGAQPKWFWISGFL